MIFKDAQVGQEILISYSPTYKDVYTRHDKSLIYIPALVVEQDPGNYTLMGWTSKQIIPDNSASVTLKQDWVKKYNLVEVHKYINWCECKLNDDSETSGPIAKSIAEKTCRNSTCKKLNDLGAKTCWWCQVSNPTS